MPVHSRSVPVSLDCRPRSLGPLLARLTTIVRHPGMSPPHPVVVSDSPISDSDRCRATVLGSCQWRCTVITAHRVSRAMLVLSCLAIGFIVMGHAAQSASAQVLYGSIVGTLTDETGAVIPKAQVTVTNTSTGLSRQVTTDDAGYYSIPEPAGGCVRSVRDGKRVQPVHAKRRHRFHQQRHPRRCHHQAGRGHRTSQRRGQQRRPPDDEDGCQHQPRHARRWKTCRCPGTATSSRSSISYQAPHPRGFRTRSPIRRDAPCRPTSTVRSAAPTTRASTDRPTSW